ncbi:M15 family metallopeptidase [Mycobacterium sp. pV006]|uniref:M15 family metallopeptidase n=1 Tax=Mycobacterium sp. pV006 TaxID=3238983 RepID=UPI00351AD4B6
MCTAAAAVLVGCAGAQPPQPAPPEPTVGQQPRSLPPETVRTVTPPPRPRPATVQPVTAADLASTWRPGCPVPPEQLRRVELEHVGFDGRTHRGVLVVHQDVVDEVVDVFGDLLAQGFPIERMRTPDHYPNADDELSMRDNNTSAFNCRDIPGTGSWSLHAYGRAVDINPKLNPYIDRRGDIQPANSGPWVDRTRTDPGMVHDGDGVVRAFADRGWRWGGHWRTPKDYQHYERK